MTDEDIKIRHIRLCECGLPAEHDSVCRPGRQPVGMENRSDDVQRVDSDWEDQHAERRAERYAKRRLAFDAARREQRSGISTFDLHREVLQRAARMSTVPAASIGASDAGDSDRIGPEPTTVPRKPHQDARERREAAEERAQRLRMTLRDLHEQRRERQAEHVGFVPALPGGAAESADLDRQQLLDDDPRWREHWAVIRWRLERVAELLDEAQGHGTVRSSAGMLGAEKDKLILSRANEGLRAQAVVDKLGEEIAGSAKTVQRVRHAAGLDAVGREREPSP